MEIDYQKKTEAVQKRNMIVWFAVLFGMLGLVFTGFVLYNFNLINLLPIVHPAIADKVALFTILFLAIIIFYIKRVLLVPTKIIQKAQNKNHPLPVSLFSEDEQKEKKVIIAGNAIQIYNRYMLIVWSLADLIVITSFINFILAPVLNTFLIYCVVGFYSFIINFPSRRAIVKIVEKTTGTDV